MKKKYGKFVYSVLHVYYFSHLQKRILKFLKFPNVLESRYFHNALVFQILSLTLAVKAAIARMVHQCSSFLV